MTTGDFTWFFLVSDILLQTVFVARALLRPYRSPSSRLAWAVVILVAPLVGILAYILFGEVDIGRRRAQRIRDAAKVLPIPEDPDADIRPMIPEAERLFRVGRSINGFPASGGNRAELMADSDAAIARMVEDIDAATDHVHLLFYIWLDDTNGLTVVEALKRAAARGVTCRAMADDLGSRQLIRSAHWREMREAGVRLARALPIGNPLLRMMRGRIDLRNHRKIVVIDEAVTYCGSQNCADAAFRVKPRFAPWVDIMLRFEGPVARQNQRLFCEDWMGATGEDLVPLLTRPAPPADPGFAAQVVGTGPTHRPSAMSETFVATIYGAREELVITTPYYVPDAAMQAAICASARRGVDTAMVLPKRNDSWIVAAASRSYYEELLAAGVRLYEYPLGLLHTKSMTLDGKVSLVGSANLDQRSLDLNYENNILLADPHTTLAVRARQQSYIDASERVTLEDVRAWSAPRRLLNNTVAMFGPIL